MSAVQPQTPVPYKIHNLRLTPGLDLRLFLIQWCQTQQIQAASVVSSVGSLSQAALRLANGKTATVRPGPFEILSVNGTLSAFGIHLHLALADEQGVAWGGHLLEGNLIATTCELVILEQKTVQFLRVQDAQTGYPELVIKALSPEDASKS